MISLWNVSSLRYLEKEKGGLSIFLATFYLFVLILRKAIHFPNNGVDFGSVVKSLRSPGKKTMAWSFTSKIVCRRTTASLWLCFQVHGSDASLRLFCRLQPRDVVPVLTSLLGLFNDVRSSLEKCRANLVVEDHLPCTVTLVKEVQLFQDDRVLQGNPWNVPDSLIQKPTSKMAWRTLTRLSPLSMAMVAKVCSCMTSISPLLALLSASSLFFLISSSV